MIDAYNLVLHKHRDMLYEGVQDTVYTRLRSVCLFTSGNISKCMFDWQVAEQVADCPDNRLLQEVARAVETASSHNDNGERYIDVHGQNAWLRVFSIPPPTNSLGTYHKTKKWQCMIWGYGPSERP